MGKKSDENNDILKTVDSIYKSDILLNSSELVRAHNVLETISISGINRPVDKFIYKRMFLSYLLLEKIEEARSIISGAEFKTMILNTDIYEDAVRSSISHFESQKKPALALALGAVPGLGYAYSEEKATGGVALLVISVLSALTYYSFKTDNQSIGIFIGAAAGFFYAGNIAGGYMAAKKYNRNSYNALKDDLFERLRLEEDRESLYKSYGIGNVK